MEQKQIENILELALTPNFLLVENESHLHSSGKGANSHFKIVVVSELFENHRAVKRHQIIYQLLEQGLNSNIHALAIHTFTPAEWQQQRDAALTSPNCMGHGQ